VLRTPHQIHRIDFRTDLTPIVARMDHLANAGDGWINLIPKTSDDDDDERSTSLGFFALFSGGGIGVTMATWIPGSESGRGRELPSLGISHLTCRRAIAQLFAQSVLIPDTWRVEQDHPRRGLVVRIPADEPLHQVLMWALGAVEVLMGPRPILGWRADVYLPLPS
jgi:hypothetical protein